MRDAFQTKTITELIKHVLISSGATLVGIADLQELPPEIRNYLPYGISIAVKYPIDVIKGIADSPTAEYYEHYKKINLKLDELALLAAEKLHALGYKAIAQTSQYINKFAGPYSTLLPHKTIATRAGLGFIGKNALLTNPLYGSAIRLTSVLTDAPLLGGIPINEGQCGDCQLCLQYCPAQAIKGNLWNTEVSRESLVDVVACEQTARARSFLNFGEKVAICGKCIEICPFTHKYLKRNTEEEYALQKENLLHIIENIPIYEEGSIGDYGLWYDALEEHFSPLKITDITDIDNEKVYCSAFLIPMTKEVKSLSSKNFDSFLEHGKDIYFFNIEISDEKPLAYVDYWRYFKGKPPSTNDLEVSSKPFLSEQKYYLEQFEKFAFKHHILLLSKEETEIPIDNTKIYNKYFNES